MNLWYPPNDEPHLFEWWRPLVLLSAAVRRDEVPWPIHIDEFRLKGRVDRKSRPAIWIYAHQGGGEVYVDGTGQAYRFIRTPNGRSLGRFTPCEVRRAVWGAGLPDAVEPMWYSPPPPAAWVEPADVYHGNDGHHDGATDAPEAPPPAPDQPRRRGHLTVYQGGRNDPLAG